MSDCIETRIIPYDARLKDRARDNRKNPTKAEQIIWQKILRKRQLCGYKFVRQKPITEFILDFYCSELLIGIEIDGTSHDDKTEYDRDRTIIIKKQQIDIIRYSNYEVINHIDRIINDLEKKVLLRASLVKGRCHEVTEGL